MNAKHFYILSLTLACVIGLGYPVARIRGERHQQQAGTGSVNSDPSNGSKPDEGGGAAPLLEELAPSQAEWRGQIVSFKSQLEQAERAAVNALQEPEGTGNAESRRARVRRHVEAAFEARQQLQRTELNKLRKRLEQIEQSIAAREHVKDEIIDHRVKELLNPELQWSIKRPTVAPVRNGSVSESAGSNTEGAPIESPSTPVTPSTATVAEIHWRRPHEATLTSSVGDNNTVMVIPGRLSLATGQTTRLSLGRLPDLPGVEFTVSIELPAVSEVTKPVLEHTAIPIELTNEDVDRASEGNLVTQVFYLPTQERLASSIETRKLLSERLEAGVDPHQHVNDRGHVVAVLRLGNRSANASQDRIFTGPDTAAIVGQDAGELIYNDRLKRFKFQLEKIQVDSVAEVGEAFWQVYSSRGNPKITGAWGDPRTNSIVVVGPPEADQAIRETIAEWEAAFIGIDGGKDESLEATQKRTENRRRFLLEQITKQRLEMIELEASDRPDKERLDKLKQQLDTSSSELELAERMLEVIEQNIKRLGSKIPGGGGFNSP